MKTIFFIFTLFVFSFVNSQIIKIKVYESTEFINYDTLGLIHSLSDTSEPIGTIKSNCEYVIDLTNKIDMFFQEGILENEADISFVNEGTLYIINFLYEGLDVGIVINTDIRNESFNWFSRIGDYYNLVKATKFEIIKSQ